MFFTPCPFRTVRGIPPGSDFRVSKSNFGFPVSVRCQMQRLALFICQTFFFSPSEGDPPFFSVPHAFGRAPELAFPSLSIGSITPLQQATFS